MNRREIRSPALVELESKAIPYRLFIHAGPITSLEQAAAERGQAPNQVVRSILFRLAKDSFCMALVAGSSQIDWRGLRRYLNQSLLTMATPEEVLRVTGYLPGAVSPFGLPAPLPVLADPNVFEPDEISLGSGVRGAAIIIKPQLLIATLSDLSIQPLIKSQG